MLRDAHGPQNANGLGFGDLIGDLNERVNGIPVRSAANSIVNGARLSRYLSRSVDPCIQKLCLGESVVEQIATDGGKPDEVRARRRADIDVGPAGHFVFA